MVQIGTYNFSFLRMSCFHFCSRSRADMHHTHIHTHTHTQSRTYIHTITQISTPRVCIYLHVCVIVSESV